MIYLFNSAYRALYTVNVLNTLFLPNGNTNEYRYRVTGTPRYIAPEAYETLKNSRRSEKAVIVFIDRFGTGGYIYHPLRLAELVLTREENDQLFFRVQLQDFIYPRNMDDFNNHIKRSLSPHGLPQLTGGNPEATADGNYAISANSIFEQRNDFFFGPEAWVAAVNGLSVTRAFRSIATDQVVFIRADVREKSSAQKSLTPKLENDSAVYDVIKGSNYELALTYRYPIQLTDQTKMAKLGIELDDSLRPLGSKTININSHANSEIFSFATKKFLEDNESAINFSFSAFDTGVSLRGPEKSLRFKIKESKMFWVEVALALLALSVLSIFMGIDLSKTKPLTLGNFFSQHWPKVVGGVAQTFILFALFRLIGKKVL